MANTGLNTVFYMLAFIVQISIWSTTEYHHTSRNPKPANLVAGGFATANTFVYGFGTILLYKEWKRSKEMVNTGIDTVLYCIGFIVQLAVWVSPYRGLRVTNLIAGVFGIFNTIAYGYGTLMLHKEWKSSRTTN